MALRIWKPFILIQLIVIIHVHSDILAVEVQGGTPESDIFERINAILEDVDVHDQGTELPPMNDLEAELPPMNDLESQYANMTTATKIKYGCVPPDRWKLMYPIFPIPANLRNLIPPVQNICLSETSDPYTTPLSNSDLVEVHFDGSRIKVVDETYQKIQIDLQLTAQWQDQGIKPLFDENATTFKLPPIVGERKSMLWIPSFVIANMNADEKKALKVMNLVKKQNGSLVDTSSASQDEFFVKMVMTKKVEGDCKFDFSDYPFDTHDCKLMIIYDQFDFEIQIPIGMSLAPVIYPVDGFYVAQLPIVPVSKYSEIHWRNVSYFGMGVRMIRNWEPNLYLHYLPTIAIVVVSGFSFFIPYSAIAGRIGLVVTLFLTMAMLFSDQMVSFNLNQQGF